MPMRVNTVKKATTQSSVLPWCKLISFNLQALCMSKNMKEEDKCLHKVLQSNGINSTTISPVLISMYH